MAKTLILCRAPERLTAFLAGVNFSDPDAGIDRELPIESGTWALITDDSDEDNATYDLTKDGLVFNSTGVEV